MSIRFLKSIVAATLLLTLLLSNALVFGAETPRFASPPKWYARQDPYPPSWANTLPWTGELQIRFSPGWGDTNSPFFWSYVLFYWLKGDVLTNRTELEKALHGYDAGLYGQKFSPERIKLEVEDKPPTTKLGHAVTMRWVSIRGFDAEMTQRELTTHLKTFRWYCPELDHTALVILRTPQPFEVTNEVWTTLSTFWDSAACHDERAIGVIRRSNSEVAVGFEQKTLAAAVKDRGERIDERILHVETNLPPAIIIEGDDPANGSLEQRMRFYKTPGVSIAVVNNGKIEWARAYGVREAGTTNPVTTNTIFQAASISKAVAAVAALRLVEMDRLNLDEDVNRRLISWKVPDSGFTHDRKVTLRGLLSHSSGITDRADFQGFTSSEPFPALVEILEGRNPKLPQQVQLAYVPGTQWQYSGSGYCVMQQLVEDVTGKRFPAVALELVLTPLGMMNSSFQQPLPLERARVAATGHQIGGDPVPGKWFALPEALGGLWTTPTDLARFVVEIQKAKAGETNRILSPAMAGQMLTRQARNWGLGLGLEGEGRAARFQHGGSVGGFECNLVGYVGSGQGAVVMTSGNQGWLLAREILWSVAREYNWADYFYAPEQKAVVAVNPGNLMKYVGRYEIDPALASNLVFIVTTENGGLFVKRAQSTQSTELHPVSETTFFMLQDQLEVTFVSDAAGAVSEIRSNRGWAAKRVDK